MNEEQFEEAIERLADALPDKVNSADMALLIANIVNLYGFDKNWPQTAFAIGSLLNAHTEHEQAAKDKAIAVVEATQFMKRVMDGT
tara:strand:- start:135 stop:392 length:258 start_codon:yes stop_codon:yes gene_type:complete